MILESQTLRARFLELLIKYKFPAAQAKQIADVFTETTLDGVFSHGINRFPRFISEVRKGIVVPGVGPERMQAYSAFEQWDGRRGAGITNALFCADRSVKLASAHGIGCIGLRNTNHWMRGGSYGWKTAEKGYLFLGWTNTTPNMPPWGGSVATLGNNPFVMAIPHREGPLVLDMAMSQFSYGKLEWKKRTGEELPADGGYNLDNKLSRDPGEILESQRILPAGLWKGSALALVLDLAAAILSGGNTTREIGTFEAETALSQVYIAVDIEKFISAEQRDRLVRETLSYMKKHNGQARYPGQRSRTERLTHLENGVDIPDSIWSEIQHL